MQRFHATNAAVTTMDELNAFVVVLAENADGSGRRLELQRALAFDAVDRESGVDTYCLCTESGAMHYGGVSAWELRGRLLRLVLDAHAARSLGAEEGFEITLSANAEEVESLVAGLTRVLVGPRSG